MSHERKKWTDTVCPVGNIVSCVPHFHTGSLACVKIYPDDDMSKLQGWTEVRALVAKCGCALDVCHGTSLKDILNAWLKLL